jgi:nuclear transcription factor Y gamma
MKTDEDVKMISSDAPALFAKACELFLIEITHRAWIHADGKRRKTLQKEDIKSCISRTEIFDFLLDLVGPHSYS